MEEERQAGCGEELEYVNGGAREVLETRVSSFRLHSFLRGRKIRILWRTDELRLTYSDASPSTKPVRTQRCQRTSRFFPKVQDMVSVSRNPLVKFETSQ